MRGPGPKWLERHGAVGGRILFATGAIGSKSTAAKLELPKITTGVK
jgi:hypothetical protein